MTAEEARKIADSNQEEKKKRKERMFKEHMSYIFEKISGRVNAGDYSFNFGYTIGNDLIQELITLGYKVALVDEDASHEISW